ncbi:hypothetical protein SPLC1_S041450 [Arthrospira platensis C1]|uniref:Uncharacterized protein n=2 Tax=Limnospira TaxID=2596745 RepID=B5W9Y1_LIMMA|nr:hypothetical protein AmaxDRAFT_5581 [Limnospira maxima CS-328]EKD08236.1 hypothetical protein SPLC1_S260080 [Arthrospira platensis C1]EKD11147.1 hypothetical protein SPLC1_S041450 [Arthrospira platensis C1]
MTNYKAIAQSNNAIMLAQLPSLGKERIFSEKFALDV